MDGFVLDVLLARWDRKKKKKKKKTDRKITDQAIYSNRQVIIVSEMAP